MAQTISPQVAGPPIHGFEGILKPQFCWDGLDDTCRNSCIADGDYQIKFKTSFGQKFGWDVAGPAQTFWNEVLAPRIKEHYESRRAYILKNSFWDGATKCFMVGRFKHTAKPAVVIMCDQRSIARRFAKIIRQDPRFQSSHFDLLVWEGILEFRAGTKKHPKELLAQHLRNLSEMSKAQHSMPQLTQESIFGVKIRAEMRAGISRTATLGGVIELNKELYGLTVAHLFREDRRLDSKLNHTDLGELYDPLEDDSDEDDDDIFIDEGCENLSNEGIPSLGSSYPFFNLITVYRQYAGSALGYYGTLSSRIGANSDLDWALVKIPRAQVEQYNRRKLPLTLCGFPSVLEVKRITTRPPKVVCMLNDSMGPLEIVESYLSATVALISLPGSSRLIEAYTMNNRTEPGDCGTWVVDFTLGDAFGVVVAQASNSDLTFVLPLHEIVNSISSAWAGLKVSMPLDPSLEERGENRPPQTEYAWIKDQLRILAMTPLEWEDPGLCKYALNVVPPELHDSVEGTIQPLLDWFNTSFFSWLPNPNCSACGKPTRSQRLFESTTDRLQSRLDIFRCISCDVLERSYNYVHASEILTQRSGFIEQGKYCFGLLCRALGYRVRWVWYLGDHSWSTEDDFWLEIYSVKEKRWVHVDPRLGLYDCPDEYMKTLKRKITYCLALSTDGANDVTRRYCGGSTSNIGERRWPSAAVSSIMKTVRNERRIGYSAQKISELENQDAEEEKELQRFVVSPPNLVEKSHITESSSQQCE